MAYYRLGQPWRQFSTRFGHFSNGWPIMWVISWSIVHPSGPHLGSGMSPSGHMWSVFPPGNDEAQLSLHLPVLEDSHLILISELWSHMCVSLCRSVIPPAMPPGRTLHNRLAIAKLWNAAPAKSLQCPRC